MLEDRENAATPVIGGLQLPTTAKTVESDWAGDFKAQDKQAPKVRGTEPKSEAGDATPRAVDAKPKAADGEKKRWADRPDRGEQTKVTADLTKADAKAGDSKPGAVKVKPG